MFLNHILRYPDPDEPTGGDDPNHESPPADEPQEDQSSPLDMTLDDIVDFDENPNLSHFKGKAVKDVLKSSSEYRKTSDRKISELQNKIKELESKGKPKKPEGKTPSKSDDPAPEPEAEERVSNEEWANLLRSYIDDGEADGEALDAVVDRTGLSERDVLDVLATKKQQRDNFMRDASDVTGDNDPQELVAWLESGEAPYSDAVLMGMMELAQDGDYSFMSAVSKKFDQWREDGNDFTPNQSQQNRQPQRNARPNNNGPARGRPVNQKPDGFQSRQEYMDAKLKAEQSGNQTEIRKVQEQLERSQIARWKDRQPHHA